KTLVYIFTVQSWFKNDDHGNWSYVCETNCHANDSSKSYKF
ncbi:32118_t:CDS:1, partial [Gigaspora margarita]